MAKVKVKNLPDDKGAPKPKRNAYKRQSGKQSKNPFDDNVYCLYCNYKNKNWLPFLFIVKAAVLKQQISKFYPQIQRTEASDHIYFSQRPFINVKAIFCA